MINEQFVSPKIQKRYIDNALNLAPIGYRLYNLKVDTGFDYSDIPANTTQEEYEKLIKDISFNDVQEYSDNILKIQIFMLLFLQTENFIINMKKKFKHS